MVDEWYSLYLLHEVNLHLGLSNNLVDKVNGEYRGYLVHLPASSPPPPVQQQEQQQQEQQQQQQKHPEKIYIFQKKCFLLFLDGTFQAQA